MRLIDADVLVSLLENHLGDYEMMVSEHGQGIAHGTRLAIARLAEQPTIDPESLIPEAYWVEHSCDEWFCTNCSDVIHYDTLDSEELPKHCPNCGAKMEKITYETN